MLKKDCSTSNIQFQNVRGKDGDEAFLIKDKVKCARIYNNDKAYKESMQVFWNWCLKGGFSILFMTRRGKEILVFLFKCKFVPEHFFPTRKGKFYITSFTK